MTTRNRSLAFIVTLCLTALLGGCPSTPAPVGTDSGPVGTDTGPVGTDTGPVGTDTGPVATDTGPAVDAPVTGPSCEAYCAAIMTNCTAANAQYTGMDNCLANCDAFPVGALTDMAGNTVGCRLYHATAAAGAAATHCGHAGPSGGGVCGSPCDGYCAIALANCTGTEELFADAAACATACGTITDDVDYTTAATGGDSLACRIYHLSAAADAPATHCAHGDVDGGGTGGPCT